MQRRNIMDGFVKMWQFLAGIVAVIITFSTMVYNRGTMEGKYIERIAIQDMKINAQAEEIKELKVMIYNLTQEQYKSNDDIKNRLNDVMILLQNKQDRR